MLLLAGRDGNTAGHSSSRCQTQLNRDLPWATVNLMEEDEWLRRRRPPRWPYLCPTPRPMILEIRVGTTRKATPNGRDKHFGKAQATDQSTWSVCEPLYWLVDARTTMAFNVPSWRRLSRPKQNPSKFAFLQACQILRIIDSPLASFRPVSIRLFAALALNQAHCLFLSALPDVMMAAGCAYCMHVTYLSLPSPEISSFSARSPTRFSGPGSGCRFHF